MYSGRGSIADLARVLANDNKMRVTVSGEGSYITQDGHINIAVMPNDHIGRSLAIGLVAHEVGHKNHSDLKSKPPGLLGTMTNIIEDIWTERETIAARPGTRFNLDEVTTHYAAKGGMKPNDLNQAICGKLMAYGRGDLLGQKAIKNIEAECDEIMEDAFGKQFIDDLMVIAKDIGSIKSSAEAIAVATRVESLVINQKQEEEDGDGEEEGDGNAGQGVGTGHGNGTGNSQEEEDPARNNPQGDGSDSGPDTGAKNGKGAGGKCSNAEIDEALNKESSFGDLSKMIQDEMDNISESMGKEQYDTPKYPNLCKDTTKHNKMNEVQALSASSKMRAQMMGMLQDVKRCPESFGTSGKKLKTSRLEKIALGDPKIFTKKKEVKEMNTAVVVAIDYSGSMSSVTRISNPAAFAIHHALAGLKGLAACSVGFGLADDHGNEAIKILVDFKEKPESSKFNLGASGGTPTDQAIWCARAMLLSRPEPRKLVLIVTDGEPNSCTMTNYATERAEKDGIEIAAIGIGAKCVKRLWKKSRCIDKVEDLPRSMFEILGDMLEHNK